MVFSAGRYECQIYSLKMRRLHGLSALSSLLPERLTEKRLAEVLLQDLQYSRMIIEGNKDEQPVVLAELQSEPEMLVYEPFDKRIDLVLEGRILRGDCAPLTYCLQGGKFRVTGRCSMIPKVCGVDLYLSHSYSGNQGDVVRQKMKIYLAEVMQALRSHLSTT